MNVHVPLLKSNFVILFIYSITVKRSDNLSKESMSIWKFFSNNQGSDLKTLIDIKSVLDKTNQAGIHHRIFCACQSKLLSHYLVQKVHN